jgi:hypothetical protein
MKTDELRAVACIRLVRRLVELAHRPHYNCEEDTWYGCPLSVDGCSNDAKAKDKCDCGADEHNAEVSALAKEIESSLCDSPNANMETPNA